MRHRFKLARSLSKATADDRQLHRPRGIDRRGSWRPPGPLFVAASTVAGHLRFKHTAEPSSSEPQRPDHSHAAAPQQRPRAGNHTALHCSSCSAATAAPPRATSRCPAPAHPATCYMKIPAGTPVLATQHCCTQPCAQRPPRRPKCAPRAHARPAQGGTPGFGSWHCQLLEAAWMQATAAATGPGVPCTPRFPGVPQQLSPTSSS
jgi:hypothetical protein